jgi:hypothetical protein
VSVVFVSSLFSTELFSSSLLTHLISFANFHISKSKSILIYHRSDQSPKKKKLFNLAKTTNMSREDTDLVGLTLGTLEAFSKLEHLLRSRRKQLQILDLRIKSAIPISFLFTFSLLYYLPGDTNETSHSQSIFFITYFH